MEKNARPPRRAFLAAGALAVAGCATEPRTDIRASRESDSLSGDIAAYASFGNKSAGGEGDNASGVWIETNLAQVGFIVERRSVPSAVIREENPALEISGVRLPITSHTLGPTKQFGSIKSSLRVWGAPANGIEADGAIVVAHLPNQRWSSAEQPLIRQTIERAFAQGAAALVLVTHGPTRELIRLNRRFEPVAHPGPIALLAPQAWANLPANALETGSATLSLNATESIRDAFNVVGRIDRGAGRTIVISTPRSGWTACVGERAPGIACFLALARRAPSLFPRHNLLFICTSAHEFENAGAAAILSDLAPSPEHTELWLHLGAGFAARDWHETGGQLAPLPSPDPQRFLVASPHLIDRARATFDGLTGLEAPYSTERGAAGELSNIIAAGYLAVIGLFGAHRFHHVAQDDMRCIEPAHVQAVLSRLDRLMRATAASSR